MQPYAAPNPISNNPLVILNRLSNIDKHRLLVPVVAAVNELDSWVASDNASVEFTFIELGLVEHDSRILELRATPTNPALPMRVQPRSGLHLQLLDTGAENLRIDVVDLLRMLHHHVRRYVIALWFESGRMPPKPLGRRPKTRS